MPIIELINHSSKSSGYTIGKGISVKGLYSDEVTVNYQPLCDALRRFFAYGFASHELLAFSLPLSFELQQGLRLAIGNNLNSVVNEGRLILPKVVQRDGRRILSHLRIGSEGTPRIPRTLIRKALPDVPVAVVDEAFERVRSTNLAILCDLLELTEVYENQLVPTLRQTILCQLRALTHCYGVRTEGQTVL